VLRDKLPWYLLDE